MIEIQEYKTEHGISPFQAYLAGMRDLRAKSKVIQAINKMELGLVGNIKNLGGYLQEYKIDEGEGHRIYFYRDGQTLIILLGGSTKKDQRKAIEQARTYLEDYKRQINRKQGEIK